MKDCTCNDPKTCCKNGMCNLSCNVCKPQNFSDNAMTGLGICPMNPRKLAERLEKFFGDRSKKSCDCRCNGSTSGSSPSCCCLACKDQDCSSQKSCFCSTPQCSCASKLQLQTSQCPCKDFCQNINSIKVTVGSRDMRCCNEGSKCHCGLGLTSGSQCSGDCCEDVNKSLKCMLRRLVSYFKDLDTSSSGKFFKSCCELLCVVKCCEFLKGFYDKRTAKECSKCKSGTCSGSPPGSCCSGSTCSGSSSGPCSTCPECTQICAAKNFHDELSKLRFAGPCGQNLYRVLDDFLHCCGALHTILKAYEERIKKAQEKCSKCCPQNPSGQSCQCSTSDCEACFALLQDSELKTLLRHGYLSSYDSKSARWNLLCSQSQRCSGCTSKSCPCHKSTFSFSPNCDSKPCCKNCNVKKAAKIFLGMLPCLYYALDYLYKQCKGDWNALNISNNSLRRFFAGMGYDVGQLQDKKGSKIFTLLSPLFTSSKGPLKKLYNVSKKYFTSRSPSLVPSSDSQPKTVREMLLWLSGLPFTSGFEALLDHCKDLCKPVSSLNFDNFGTSLYSSCLRSPFVLAAIQWPGKSEIFPSDSSINSDSLYPSDPSDLFNMLVENVRKIFAPLKFLEYQCGKDRNSAGWKDCGYGQKCLEKFNGTSSTSTSECCSDSLPRGIFCTSVPGVSNVHEHCTNGHSCIGPKGPCDNSSSKAHSTSGQACSNPCPHPLLKFLCDIFPFSLPGITPMGFKDHLPATGKSGESLSPVLNSFCDSSSSSLANLFKFLTCISRTPPENLGEFFSFFKVFVPKLDSNFADYASKEPGGPNGQNFTNALKDALGKLYGSHSGNSHSGSHPYDLRSLIDCHVPQGAGEDVTCGRYLYSLTGDVYDIFVEDFVDTYLSWVCHVPRMFREKVEEFQEKFSDCCSSGSCKTIIYCPCAWPLISSQGFSFTSRGSLSGKKSCSDFIEQLGKVAQGSPLQDLLDAIDAFLWSIRKPFFLFVLSFWILVLAYFIYVHLYHLDVLELNSHDHPAWSFKIPPSILFSDSSSKISGIRYFHPW
ncbi:variant erythrocyte surface antigen-1 family protein [Babesia divergens]|uniref:Variant erythrocyte surface antigen-1 family protein n=1 Tax=Babesia divergens TaxID=32595 RepID=A0AAD9GBA6_BABDI|nr:variant erythrocyte surface antigen-1 family protein [Babesia divergens]